MTDIIEQNTNNYDQLLEFNLPKSKTSAHIVVSGVIPVGASADRHKFKSFLHPVVRNMVVTHSDDPDLKHKQAFGLEIIVQLFILKNMSARD